MERERERDETKWVCLFMCVTVRDLYMPIKIDMMVRYGKIKLN